MTETEKLQQMGMEVEMMGKSRRELACLKSRARNYRLEIERCHRMLCRWLGEEDKGVGNDDGKAFDEKKWPTPKDLFQLQEDMNRTQQAISEGENMLRECGAID